MNGFTLLLGGINAGLMVSPDAGSSWSLADFRGSRYPGEIDVRGIAVSAADPDVVWVTTHNYLGGTSVLRSIDGGWSFDPIGRIEGHEAWTLVSDPHDPDTLYAGTRPMALFKSTDSGATWTKLDFPASSECSIGPTRTTTVTFDADHPERLWVGVEIGGLWYSPDRGTTWNQVSLFGGEGMLGAGETWTDERHLDIHGIDVHDGVVSVAVPIGLFRTADHGETWRRTRYLITDDFDASMFYTRSVRTAGALFAGVGWRPPDHGVRGGIQRSDDGGVTWRPVSPIIGSVVWLMSSHDACPGVIAGVGVYGEVLLSQDGGEHFERIERRFGETRTIAVLPTQ